MPVACAGPVAIPPVVVPKYHYLDHDSYVVDITPAVQNQWYTVFDLVDVRCLMFRINQTNAETAAKDVAVRWTIDGNAYSGTISAGSGLGFSAYRVNMPAPGGLELLAVTTEALNAGLRVDKRGQTFKAEARITSAPGTNQRLRAWGVVETLEVT